MAEAEKRSEFAALCKEGRRREGEAVHGSGRDLVLCSGPPLVSFTLGVSYAMHSTG
jgi:hypothetical protein